MNPFAAPTMDNSIPVLTEHAEVGASAIPILNTLAEDTALSTKTTPSTIDLDIPSSLTELHPIVEKEIPFSPSAGALSSENFTIAHTPLPFELDIPSLDLNTPEPTETESWAPHDTLSSLLLNQPSTQPEEQTPPSTEEDMLTPQDAPDNDSQTTPSIAAATVNQQELFDHLYQALLPRLQGELALWLQETLNLHAKNLVQALLQDVKSDYDMIMADSLKDSLRQALNTLYQH